MFGKRGNSWASSKRPVHDVLTRAVWPSGGAFSGMVRDHMISIHQKRLTQKPPGPFASPPSQNRKKPR